MYSTRRCSDIELYAIILNGPISYIYCESNSNKSANFASRAWRMRGKVFNLKKSPDLKMNVFYYLQMPSFYFKNNHQK